MQTADHTSHEHRESLQDYLYTASSDGWGPEIIACRDERQAIRLHNELRAQMHRDEEPLFHAVRHEDQVTVWLTAIGHATMSDRHGVRHYTESAETLEWPGTLVN